MQKRYRIFEEKNLINEMVLNKLSLTEYKYFWTKNVQRFDVNIKFFAQSKF